MADIYTSNPYEAKVSSLRSQVGDNPAAIAQAFAQEAVKTSQPLQETIQGQGDALSQLAEIDKNLAQKYQGISQQSQQQTQNTGAMYRAAGNMAAYDPNNPQAFIDRGPAQLDLNAFSQTYAPDTALISPFAASKTADVEANVQGGVFDVAAQQRGSIERAIGSEANSLAEIARYQNEEKKAALEQARLKYEDERDYAMLMGGTVVNPLTGKAEVYSPKSDSQSAGEQSLSRLKDQALADIKSSTTPKDLFAKYRGSLDFNELMTLYNQNSPFGVAKESMEELRQMYEGGPKETAALATKEKERALTGELVDKKVEQLKELAKGYTVLNQLNPNDSRKALYENGRRELASLMARIKNPSRSPTDADIEIELVKIPDSPIGLQGPKEAVLNQIKTDAINFLGQSSQTQGGADPAQVEALQNAGYSEEEINEYLKG